MIRLKVPISEIFYSLQGEGRNTGTPVVFVRFWGCNLKCEWCDSKYAWDKDFKEEMIQMNFYKVVEEIKKYNCNHVVFTGGEPALYEPIIDDLQVELAKKEFFGRTREIETNGTRELQNYYDQVNVSYKFKSSGNDSYELKAIDERYDYKFVIDTEQDLRDMEDTIRKYKLSPDKIFLMPLGTSEDTQHRMDIANYCLAKGYKYCPRQHILLYGDKRGV